MPSGSYRIVAFGKALGIGVVGSQSVTVAAVAKSNVPAAPYCLPNEYISSEIGRFLRLPLPPAGIVFSPNAPVTQWFASLDFNLTGNSLPPVDVQRCVKEVPDLSTGLLLFDVLVANSDRHRANFAVDFLSTPPQMTVFDHSHALIGALANQGQTRLQTLRTKLAITGAPPTGGNRHCLLDEVNSDSYFDKWIKRIGAIPDFLIEETCDEAQAFGLTLPESNETISFLKHRRDNIQQIIELNKNEFHSIHQWSLI